MTVVNTKLV